MNYTEIEAKVREATNDEAWGPTGKLILKYEFFHLIFLTVFCLQVSITMLSISRPTDARNCTSNIHI